MAESESVRIGRLRWPLLLATRQQVAQALDEGTGIIETLGNVQKVRGDVQPVGALSFWAAAGGIEQVDGAPITHRIFIRWLDAVTNADAIIRQTKRVDQSIRMEIFRIRRMREIAGRKRFVILECQLEKENDPWPMP
ncbi:phage head completion protein [Gluconobacter morbifer]|uniref:phage head completion protein n=1 Tax=Gluconobacter morbifer TaxID=479935 RepID=UPI000313780C|nr:head-tail adaptor protein [Gluconobacter morbifer]